MEYGDPLHPNVYSKKYWTKERIEAIKPVDFPLIVDIDSYDPTYQKICDKLYSMAHGYTVEKIDFSIFFKGKVNSLLGMPVEEKKEYRVWLLSLGARTVYYGWNRTPDIVICGDNSLSTLEDVVKCKEKDNDIILMNLSYIYPRLNGFFESEDGKKLMEDFLTAQEKKAQNKVQTAIADEKYIRKIIQTPASYLSINKDVFHIVGNMYIDNWDDVCYYFDGYTHIGFSDYPRKKEDVYDLVRKKGGHTNTKDTGNTTCIVFGKNPPLRAFEDAKPDMKFTSFANFITWLMSHPNIEADSHYPKSYLVESCIPFIKHEIKSTKELSIYNDVFHIVGTLYHKHDNYTKGPYVPRENIYKLIESKGGLVDKENTDRTTCIVYGLNPPMDAFVGKDDNKVKYVSFSKFYSWIKYIKNPDENALVFRGIYSPKKDAKLRPYQQKIKDDIFRRWGFHYSVMLQMPTGTGKTVLFSSIINDLSSVNGTKILIIAHRTELIDQIDSWLEKYGIPHGIIQGGRERHLERPIQIASIQTYTNKHNSTIMEDFKPEFIIIDEAHHAKADTYKSLWTAYPDAWKLGVTATPYRLNHAPFMDLFSTLVMSSPMDDFIKKGFLSQYVFLADNPNGDMSKAIDSIKGRSSTGDYVIKDLLQNLNIDKFIKYDISCYLKYAKGKKGIVYAINVEHGKNLCLAYHGIGVKAEFIDSNTPKKERHEIVERFRNGETEVMVNCNIFSEGFDCPDIEFIQMTRPTYSLAMYLQQVGRGLRPSKNGSKCIILDNAGMFEKFGLPSQTIPWNRHFGGLYTKDDAELERNGNKDMLSFLCSSNKEPMVIISQEDIDTHDEKDSKECGNVQSLSDELKELAENENKKFESKGNINTLPINNFGINANIPPKTDVDKPDTVKYHTEVADRMIEEQYRIMREHEEEKKEKAQKRNLIIKIIAAAVAIMVVAAFVIFGLGALGLIAFLGAAGILKARS